MALHFGADEMKKHQPKKPRPASTPNGRIIQKALQKEGKRPSAYKDWSIFVPGSFLDWKGSYGLPEGSFEKLGSAEGEMVLVHKSQLHLFLPEEMAARFWHRSLQRRVVSMKGRG